MQFYNISKLKQSFEQRKRILAFFLNRIFLKTQNFENETNQVWEVEKVRKIEPKFAIFEIQIKIFSFPIFIQFCKLSENSSLFNKKNSKRVINFQKNIWHF